MISKIPGVILFTLCAVPMGWAQQTEAAVQGGFFVPAGTLLGCTLDEPNFSSQTASTGDPVLCKANSLLMFGRQLIPRGAYLTAHLEDYKDPGHFFGKGWIQLEFTSLALPGGTVPLNAKIISAARYRVNRDGKVLGHGHPTRDAIEWSIPILWPIKVLTLPARGPRPTFKGETRIQLRLMEDLLIPESVYSSNGRPVRSSSLQPEVDGDDVNLPVQRHLLPRSANVATLQPLLPTPVMQYQTTPAIATAQSPDVPRRLIVLVLRGGSMYFVADYWVDNGKLDYITSRGVLENLPLNALDLPTTSQINAERGLTFALVARAQ
jgi:hypothetical protein